MVRLTMPDSHGGTPEVPRSAARVAALPGGSFPRLDAETRSAAAAPRSFRGGENVRHCGTSSVSALTSQKHPSGSAAQVPHICGTSVLGPMTDSHLPSIEELDAEIASLAARLERGYDYTGPGEDKWFSILARYEAAYTERHRCQR